MHIFARVPSPEVFRADLCAGPIPGGCMHSSCTLVHVRTSLFSSDAIMLIMLRTGGKHTKHNITLRVLGVSQGVDAAQQRQTTCRFQGTCRSHSMKLMFDTRSVIGIMNSWLSCCNTSDLLIACRVSCALIVDSRLIQMQICMDVLHNNFVPHDSLTYSKMELSFKGSRV